MGSLIVLKKKKFYDEITIKIKSIYNPLLCIGDWNCLWFKEDKRGGDRILLGTLLRREVFWMMGILWTLVTMAPSSHRLIEGKERNILKKD